MAKIFKARAGGSKSAIKLPKLVSIDDLSDDGRGVSRVDKRVIFVEGALPGEQVEIAHPRSRSKFSEAAVKRVVKSSSERVVPPCSHYSLCGGCSLQHLDHGSQVSYKHQSLKRKVHKLMGGEGQPIWSDPILSSPYEYRGRIRWVIGRNGEISLRQKGSDKLVEISECPVLVPEIGSLVQSIGLVLKHIGSGSGITHIELTEGQPKPFLLVRHTRQLSGEVVSAFRTLEVEQSLSVGLQPKSKGPLFDLDGTELNVLLSYQLGEIKIMFRPGDFTQINRRVNHRLVDCVLDWLEVVPGDRVADLFCGVGNFSIPIMSRGAQVLGIEGSESMVQQANRNASANQLDQGEFFAANLENPEVFERLKGRGINKLVIDPPRAGAQKVCENIGLLDIDVLVYISCNPATLLRDAHQLLSSGYQWEKVRAVDMFPQTSHLETVALFRRKNR